MSYLEVKKEVLLCHALCAMVQLLDPLNSTNFLHLKFPLICRKIQRGENVFYLDSSQFDEYFDVKGLDVEELSTALCERIILGKECETTGERVDPTERALEYMSLIENGIVKNQSELAAYLGVSRAWVSKALKILRRHEK